MSFGFKRRPTTAPSIASNATVARRLAATNADIIDRNGNEDDTQPLTSNVVPTGRSTPRLAPPKKEALATARGSSRFGYREKVNRLNKVADLNAQTCDFGNSNYNNVVKNRNGRPAGLQSNDNNRNRVNKIGIYQPSSNGRFTLQTTQLPRPEPVRLIETKTAKTLANNNRKISSTLLYHNQEETSSKDGSLTEDSGVGSHLSGYNGDMEMERLDSSPTFGVKRNNPLKARNLEMITTSNNRFNVRDLDDSTESCAPLPDLPSAFKPNTENKRSYQTTGLVRERTLEYQKHLERDNRRKISVTSSEGFSDEEKTCKERFRNEKSFLKPTKTFLKTRTNELKDDSSPPSSDEHEWMHGGEAMADEISYSISSSDESRDKISPSDNNVNTATIIGVALKNLMAHNPVIKPDLKMNLTFEDPKFAAVAAASNTGCLLDDETLQSPIDFSISDSDELLKRKMNRSSSNSKDINEKLTPPSPGTPTNASNSLSLSDGKDDFLIDDEIADQPDLCFEDTIVINDAYSLSLNNSENTPTIVDPAPKPRRKPLQAIEGSPLMARNRKFLESRAGSLDTLSTCESIASDDLMMDFDYSQSSGLDECDKQSSGFPSLNETVLTNKKCKENKSELMRDWSALLGNFAGDKTPKTASRQRLLRSRTSTPNSIPDSPRSLDSRINGKSSTKPSATNSPAKPRFGHLTTSTGYDSDDSIRLDRSNHKAMKQDIISIKTMLLKLRRALNEQTDEDLLLRSDTHNPFDCQSLLTNGLFNGLCSADQNSTQASGDDDPEDARIELEEMRRQVLFLQGQLEDKDKMVHDLQEQMIKLNVDTYTSNSAPASTVGCDNNSVCNAATQTERIRPISAGPSLLNGSSPDGNTGSLVSATETATRRSRPPIQSDSGSSKRTPSRLWRKPGEPPSPQRYATNSSSSSIPKRANSRSRTPSTPS